MTSVANIYEIITANLFAANIEDANERLDCARQIASLLDKQDHFMKPPRDGVMLYFKEGDGCSTVIARSDPVSDSFQTWKRIDNALEKYRAAFKNETH